MLPLKKLVKITRKSGSPNSWNIRSILSTKTFVILSKLTKKLSLLLLFIKPQRKDFRHKNFCSRVHSIKTNTVFNPMSVFGTNFLFEKNRPNSL